MIVSYVLMKSKPVKVSTGKKVKKGNTKKTKASKTLQSQSRKKMCAPKQMKNIIKDNALQDWLELYHPDRVEIQQAAKLRQRDLSDNFRKYVQDYISAKLPDSVMLDRPDTKGLSGQDMGTILNGASTLKAMSNNVSAIFNAHLIDRSEALCDIADILLRSDVVRTVFPHFRSVEPYPCGTCYVVVGIRFGKNTHCVDGIKIRNTPSTRYWKTKLFIQNRILEKYTGDDAGCGILIGSGSSWKQSAKDGGADIKTSSFLSPGVIMFNGWDNSTVTTSFAKGLKWVNQLSVPSSSKWKLAPIPTVPELYANAKVSIYDTPWAPVIQDTAKKQDDITQLWHCTVTNRDKAHAAGIKKLHDASIPEDLGFKAETQTGKRIQRYLNMEFNSIKDISLNLSKYWTTLDFESLSISTVKYHEDKSITTSCVYLACLDDKQYGLVSTDMTADQAEYALVKDLHTALTQQKVEAGKDFQIYCWGDAEARYMYNLESKYPDYPLGSDFSVHLVNLMEIFVENDIILPGQYNNSLSSVAQAMNLTVKKATNTSALAENVFFGQGKIAKASLEQLLSYNQDDTRILREIIHTIMNVNR
jgi:hypothetical protein